MVFSRITELTLRSVGYLERDVRYPRKAGEQWSPSVSTGEVTNGWATAYLQMHFLQFPVLSVCR